MRPKSGFRGRKPGQTHCACGKALRRDNATGVCNRNACQNLRRPSHGRGPCVLCHGPLRRQTTGDRHTICARKAGVVRLERGCVICGRSLRGDNTTGRCSVHSATARKVCGCGRSIQLHSRACISCVKRKAA